MTMKNGYSVKNGIINGGELELPPDLNYGKVYLDLLTRYGDKMALINAMTDEKITCKEFVQKAVNVAASLQRLGVKKGDVVAICSENRIEFMVTTFAVIYIGAVANFINCAYSKDEMIHTTKISTPRYLFLSPATYKKYYEIFKSLGFISKYFIYGNANAGVNAISFEDLVKNNVDSLKAAHTDGSDTAIIVYSSGTTGLPKGVIWQHSGLIVATLKPIANDEHLTALSVAPWSNTVGFMICMENVAHGNTVVFLPKFNEKDYLQTIEKYKVGYLLGVPPLVVMLAKSSNLDKYDISSVKQILSGGAPLDSKVMADVKKRLPNLRYIFQGYGLSEATGVVSTCFANANKIGSVGKILPGTVAKVVDVKSKNILGPKQPGEILLKGASLFGGYIGKKREDDYDKDGFYKTGDIAYYDEEGYFFIVDRIKELIKYKTWQVAPSEIEAVLLQFPGVKDVGVIGVPDTLAGELPLAFVVKQLGANVTEKEIIEFVAQKMSPWKQLRGGVRFVAEIPKNGSGKILRRELRQLLKNTHSKL